ncbi:hypothetical protein BsWGS_09748 [Bradybaena similaris]
MSSSLIRDDPGRFNCDLCANSYKQRQHLNRHIASTHENRLFQCNICGLSLSANSSLKRHVRLIHATQTSLHRPSQVDAPTATPLSSPVSTIPPTHGQVSTSVPKLNADVSTSELSPKPTSLSPQPSFCKAGLASSHITQPTSLNTQSSISLSSDTTSSAILPLVDQAASSSMSSDIPTGGKLRHTCPICRQSFAHLSGLSHHHRRRHVKQQHTCKICNQIFSFRFLLTKHIKDIHKPPVAPNVVTEQTKHKRPLSTPSEPAPKRQRKESPFVFGPKNQKIWRDPEAESLSKLPIDVQSIYFDNWQTIRTQGRSNPRLSAFTYFHKPNQKYIDIDWSSLLAPILEKQTARFKINYSHHLVLRQQETKELRFYHASYNNACVLEKPVLIGNKSDFAAFVDELKQTEPLSIAFLVRENTKWQLESLAATSFFLYHLNEFPIGCLTEELPPHLRNNRYIFTLQRDAHNGNQYEDGKCFFRCLALHKGCSVATVSTGASELFDQWVTDQHIDTTIPFPGVTLVQIPVLEDLFKVKIEVFDFLEKEEALILKLRSGNTVYEETIHLLHYKNHFMYISEISNATHTFACPKCKKLWRRYGNMHQHEQTCNGAITKESYAGGVYTPPATIWETVASHGVRDTPINFVYPFRMTYDYESFFSNTELPTVKAANASTKFTARHIPMSCAVASNVPGFEKAECFVSEGDPQVLVNKMIHHLEKIADEAYRLLKERFEYIFDQLTELDLPDLAKRLNEYLMQVPVVGFNSGKYDLNIIKSYLVTYFVDKADGLNVEEEEEEVQTDPKDVKEEQAFNYVVKRNNNFMCISTPKLKFLDVVNYIAPGFTYAKYLSAYKITEEKGVFCYEYIDTLTKLAETKLPDHKDFFSKLKNSNITPEEYEECRKVWNKENMKTLKDFLIWYNKKAVVPFLAALQKQVDFFADLHVDMLKSAISIPGVTLIYLFKTLPKGTMFTLCGEKHKDLHETMRNNITGGPSIIFHRYHEKNKTCIRGNKTKTVQSIKGFDANALYLYALMKPMPTDFAIIRKAENDFKAEWQSFYNVQNRQWLSWVAHSKNIHLQTQYNGKEMALGKRRLRVDGWDSANRTVYQFHGCMFHGHPNCPLTEGREFHPKTNTPLADLYETTQKNRTYLEEECNVTVVEMWECEWQKLKKTDLTVRHYVSETFKRVKPSYTKKVTPTEVDIIAAVKDGSLFGLVECDIHVPDEHKKRFSEMTPIFKNIEVSREDIGDYMQEYAEKNKLLSSPRRTLIGSYSGKQILLATPLLKWYLDNDLEVTKIYQVIEYKPETCFEQFGNKVSDARRDGDLDNNCTIKSETMKLLGNAAYGKTLTNKAKHVNVAYAHGNKTGKLVNNPRFKKMHEIAPDIYEVETAKEKIRWDLPLQIGFFVYQYAKLRMLEFYYDFLDKFVSRKDFQLCEMDTDSLYLALSAPTLEEVVRPKMLKRFYAVYDRWFPGEVCKIHKAAFIQSVGKNRPQNCTICQAIKLYDKRTPGLFKLEYEGNGIVSLCSKTYHCFGEYNKTSTKGLSKAQNDLQKDHFMDVIYTTESGGGKNISFKTHNSRVYSYEQYRQSLSFFYIKRQVQRDKVTTIPLTI